MFLAAAQAGLDCRCLVQSAEVKMSQRTRGWGGGRHRRHEQMRSADPSRSAQAISLLGWLSPRASTAADGWAGQRLHTAVAFV